MKWVNTKRWLSRPKAGHYFMVENDYYQCYFTLWHWALIKKVELPS